MGKLRNILSQFIKFKPESQMPSALCTHRHLPQKQQHTKLLVNATDHCISHNQKMCLVCSEVHIQQHCHVKIKCNQELGHGKLKDFNLGYMMKVPLQGLKCICGKPLGFDSNHTICSACGVATCSRKCHDEWQNAGNCTYHQNYYEKPKGIDMRSIVMTNIRNIQMAKINEWNLACKNALSYIACYAKNNANYIYLQRGYRNYGIPQPELVEKMIKMDFGLDYTTHIERVCTCQCYPCKERGWHSVGSCQYDCDEVSGYHANTYVDNAEIYHQCSCDCPFCRSGVVVSRHTKYDCGLNCYKSHYNVDRIQ